MSDAPQSHVRRPVHRRSITCEAFEADDGNIDLEAVLVDTKPTPVHLLTDRVVDAGQPIHQMRVRLTVNRDRVILRAGAFSEHRPYRECEEVEGFYQRLVGLKIEPGFRNQVNALFRGEAGCTHITELIPVLASIVYQVLWSDFNNEKSHDDSMTPVGGCHGLRMGGEVVLTRRKSR